VGCACDALIHRKKNGAELNNRRTELDFSEFGEIKQPVIFDLPQRTVIGSLAPTMPHKKFSLRRGNIF
jgi:hypothetical protein